MLVVVLNFPLKYTYIDRYIKREKERERGERERERKKKGGGGQGKAKVREDRHAENLAAY